MTERLRELREVLATVYDAAKIFRARQRAAASCGKACGPDRRTTVIVRSGQRTSVSVLQEEITGEDVMEIVAWKRHQREIQRMMGETDG